MQKLPTAAFGREVGGMRDRSVVFVLASTLLLGCVSCATPKPSSTPNPSPLPEVSALPAPTGSPTPTPEPEHTEANKVVIPVSSAPVPSTSSEDATTPEPPPEPFPSSVSIDLSDPAVYRSLNLFLSNFSECKFSSFSVEAPDHGKIADFAFMHAWINSPSAVEDCSKYFQDEYADIETCVSVSYIEKVAQRFFAGEADPASIEEAWKDGHGRGLITNGAYGYGFTLADSITDLGENRFEIQFHVYTAPNSDGPTYDASSSSNIYSAQPDNLPQPLFDPSAQFVGAPGTATIEAAQEPDGSLAFRLCTYEIQ